VADTLTPDPSPYLACPAILLDMNLARLFAVLLSCTTTIVVSAQSTVVVRFVESMAKKASFVNIVYDDGRSETIDLDGWGGMMTTPGSMAAAMKRNQQVLAGAVRSLEEKGSELRSMSSTGESVMNTFLVFSQRE
jgi:hypothetical protein